MNREQIFNKVVDIARDVFENDEVIITEESSAVDIDEWDSLSHINLISDIEAEFGVALTLNEISGSKNIGELVDALIKHLEKKQ